MLQSGNDVPKDGIEYHEENGKLEGNFTTVNGI